MEIASELTNSTGQVFKLVYRDIDDERELGDKNIKGVHAYCFYNDKLVVVYTEEKKYWTPPGGGVEEGECVSDAVRREVQEETNMKVLSQRLIGYQDIYELQGINTQTRSVCIVEPYGSFVSDPDGDITKIECIAPNKYKQYFDWGDVGDHLMKRALELKEQMEASLNRTEK